jgi:peptide/nickel transport system substrate-binding protein
MITSIDPRTGLVLDRNPRWNRATDPVRTALPDRVVVRTGLSGLERDQEVLAGSADVDVWGAGVAPATSARLADDGALRDRADEVATGAMRLLALPTNVAPMDNAACRTAVADAIDRRALQQALGGDDDVVLSSRLWPRNLPGGPTAGSAGGDPAAARRALAACGRPQGFPTVLATADTTASVKLARSVAAQLARVGIRATVQPRDAGTFYATDVGSPTTVVKRGYGIVLATWTADFPTPGSFLGPLVDGGGIRTVGNTNYAHLDDPAVNQLVTTARTGGGAAAWRAVASAAQRTAAYIPLAESRVQLVAGQRLRNGLVMQPYGGYDLATAGVR